MEFIKSCKGALEKASNYLTGSPTNDSTEPRFHLIAELVADGWLHFDPNFVRDLLSNSDGLQIAIASTVEDQIPGKPRMIDFIQYSLLDAVKPKSQDIFKAWKKNPQKQFPRPDVGVRLPELLGKNGILMKAKPFVLNTHWTLPNGKPLKKAVYLMTIWIGDRSKLNDRGFTKLADFLYFASSSVIHSTISLNIDQFETTKRFLWKGSYVHAVEDRKLKQICFVFFNWPYPYDQSKRELSESGHIKGNDFAKWAKISPVAAACQEVIQKFLYPKVYCFDAMGQNAANVVGLRLMLGLQKFEVKLEHLTTMMYHEGQFKDFVAGIINDLNQHQYPSTDPLYSEAVPPKSSVQLTPQKQQQPKPGDTNYWRTGNQTREQERKLNVAINNYQDYFDKLFLDTPDLAKLAEYHHLAFLQVLEEIDASSASEINLEAKLKSEWNNLAQQLAGLDLFLANLESEFVFLLLSSDTTHKKVVSYLQNAKKKLDDAKSHPNLSRKTTKYVLVTSGKPVLEKMTLIVETLAACKDAFNQIPGYIQNETIVRVYEGAVSMFKDPNSSLDPLAVVVLDNLFNLIETQNQSLQHKAVILASEARQSAMAEYHKSMDRLLEKAVYSRLQLLEAHDQVIKAITGTFTSENFQNKIWQDMVVGLSEEMKAQFPALFEKNRINLEAAYGRYNGVLSFAFKTYKESLGPDYDQLRDRKKQRAHDDARRAALAAYQGKVTGEPQAWISQWYKDLYERIGQESPNAIVVASAAQPSVAPAKELLAAPAAKPKTLGNAPAMTWPDRAPENQPSLASPKLAEFTPVLQDTDTVIAVSINFNDVRVSSRVGDILIQFPRRDWGVDPGFADWTLRNYLAESGSNAAHIEDASSQILHQWFSTIKYQVESQWNVRASSWIICIEAGIPCAGKRRLYNAFTSAGYVNFTIIYKCTMMALSHYFACFEQSSEKIQDHTVLVVRLLENGEHNFANVRVSTQGIEMVTLSSGDDVEQFQATAETTFSHRHPQWPTVKLIFSTETSSNEVNRKHYDVLKSCLKSKDSVVQEALILLVDPNNICVQDWKYAEYLGLSAVPPRVTEVCPYDLILDLPEKSELFVQLNRPLNEDFIVTPSWPDLDARIAITEQRYNGVVLPVATMIINKEEMPFQTRLTRNNAVKLNIHLNTQGVLTVSAATSTGSSITLKTLEGPDFGAVSQPPSPTSLPESIVIDVDTRKAETEVLPVDQVAAPEVPANASDDGGALDTDVEMEDLQIDVAPEEHKLKSLLRACVEEMEEAFSQVELSRPVKRSVRLALDTAKQILELPEPSEPKLKQTINKLNVWRPSLNMSVVAIDED